MGYLEELAEQDCERLTSREGCLGKNGYPKEEQCPPCRARVELGIDLSVRRCTNCGAPVEDPVWEDGRWGARALDGTTYCPPPRHSPKLYYGEFTKTRDLARTDGRRP